MVAGGDGEEVVGAVEGAFGVGREEEVVVVAAEAGDAQGHADLAGGRAPQEVAEIEHVVGNGALAGRPRDVEHVAEDVVAAVGGEVQKAAVITLMQQEAAPPEKTVILWKERAHLIKA